ncbi:MAG: hypothetical protein WCL14_03515 [Bacteroidota bacterium]
MKKILHALLLMLFILFFMNIAQAQKNNVLKPAYAGHIDYANGNFGTFNYPQSGDSVIVFITDSLHINVLIFHGQNVNEKRAIEAPMGNLKLMRRKVYDDIQAPDKIIPTTSVDAKYLGKSASHNGTSYTLTITHFGNGNIANLVFVEEHGGVRIDNLFLAVLKKIQQ